MLVVDPMIPSDHMMHGRAFKVTQDKMVLEDQLVLWSVLLYYFC